jgi:hypothetical protein
VGLLKQQQSYQLNCLQIRIYQGKRQLSFPSTVSIDEVSDLEDTIEPTSTSDDDSDEELQAITVSGIRQLETIYTCINYDNSKLYTLA